jgi:hypothetical protein
MIRMNKSRTTIGLKTHTKEKLDQNRAPGQCYDGFLCQMIDLWEKTHDSNLKKAQVLMGINGGDIEGE